MIIFAVAIAGAAGTLSRYGLDRFLRARWPGQPTLPILLINISGSLLLGVITGLVLFASAPTALRTVAGTGFCASYTTFSTASYETFTLLRQGRWGPAVAHGAVTLAATTLAAGLGLVTVALMF